MAYNAIPAGNKYWAMVLAFSVAVAALLFGLWIIRPEQLSKYMHKNQAAQVPAAVPAPPPPPPPLPVFFE